MSPTSRIYKSPHRHRWILDGYLYGDGGILVSDISKVVPIMKRGKLIWIAFKLWKARKLKDSAIFKFLDMDGSGLEASRQIVIYCSAGSRTTPIDAVRIKSCFRASSLTITQVGIQEVQVASKTGPSSTWTGSGNSWSSYSEYYR